LPHTKLELHDPQIGLYIERPRRIVACRQRGPIRKSLTLLEKVRKDQRDAGSMNEVIQPPELLSSLHGGFEV